MALLLAGLTAGCAGPPGSDHAAGAADGNGAATPRDSRGNGAASRGALSGALAARLDSLDAPALVALYSDTAPPTARWVDEDGLTGDGREALDRLRAAGAEGLDPDRYGVQEIETRAGSATTPEALAALETRLTVGLADLTGDLARGRLRQAGYQAGWRIDSLDAPGLPDGADSRHVLAHLDSVRPRARQYDRLTDLLDRLTKLASRGGWPRVTPPDRPLSVGDSAGAVAAVRERLAASLDPEERRLAGQGGASPAVFDSTLADGLKRFQSRHGIQMDGVLGPNTVRELNAPAEQRMKAVRVALERWRWLPSRLELGRPAAVLVNTGGRRVHVFADGVPEISMKVIVGQRDWKTIHFQDVMEEVVVHPYWNVPENILAEDILPKVRENPDYLRANDFELVSREDWDPVPLSSVDWNRVEPRDFPYLLRQRPGDQNALGYVKFRFPNQWAIYLHDTPADHLFDDRIRTFSHGCIRVERPTELAEYIFEHATDLPPSRFLELKRTGERHEVQLDTPIPTYIVYQTVWVDGEGIPTFFPDIYDRNDDLDRTLERVLPDGSLAE